MINLEHTNEEHQRRAMFKLKVNYNLRKEPKVTSEQSKLRINTNAIRKNPPDT